MTERQQRAALDELHHRQEMAEQLERFLLLTPRQQQIARLYTNRTTEQVAHRLCLSEHTIKNHLIVVYAKLGITTPHTKKGDLCFLLGFVEGFGARRLRIVTHREAA